MENILVIVHLALSIGLVGLILIQHGKGADAGAAFGSGASATVFGSRGSGNFLTRTTGFLATGFFITSLVLAGISMDKAEQEGVVIQSADSTAIEQTSITANTDLPVVPEDAAPAVSDVPAIAEPAADGVPQSSIVVPADDSVPATK